MKRVNARLHKVSLDYRAGIASWTGAFNAVTGVMQRRRETVEQSVIDWESPFNNVPADSAAEIQSLTLFVESGHEDEFVQLLQAVAGSAAPGFHKAALTFLLSPSVLANFYPNIRTAEVRSAVPQGRQQLNPRFEELYLRLAKKACYLERRTEASLAHFYEEFIKMFQGYHYAHMYDKRLVSLIFSFSLKKETVE